MPAGTGRGGFWNGHTGKGEKMEEIFARRSIRKFKPGEVPTEMIDAVLKAGACAPSAKNRQPWKYIVYRGGEKERLLREMERGLVRERDGKSMLPESRFGISDAFNTLRIMRQAPVLVMILNTNGGSPFEPIGTERRVSEICDSLSIGASVQNILLAATGLGLGTLWIANTCFAYGELAAFVGEAGQLVGAIAVGYADEAPAARPRKAFEETVEYRG